MTHRYSLDMLLANYLTFFTAIDYFAIGFILISWLGLSLAIEHSPKSFPSVSRLMASHRRAWMVQMVSREPRIFDSQTLSSLRQGTAFFMSACMLAFGGGLTLIASTDKIQGVMSDLSTASVPAIIWDVKILFILLFLVNGFLKFVWSHRLLSYCHILMGTVPNDPDHKDALPLAAKAAELNISAGRSYNRGLRSVYFAIAACAWFFGSIALIAATLITLIVMIRREFASHSRKVLLQPSD